MTLVGLAAMAQNVTTFLGIPVDGTKAEMRSKLIAKGYQTVAGEEFLTGEFNGQDVVIYIYTNNNKVWRVAVANVNDVDEAQIKIHFNTLVRQFESNKRYVSYNGDQTIGEDVDISYEMSVHSKQFQANFYQVSDSDSFETASPKQVWFSIFEKYGRYRIAIYYENLYNQANGEDL